jgi:hypothetical protein
MLGQDFRSLLWCEQGTGEATERFADPAGYSWSSKGSTLAGVAWFEGDVGVGASVINSYQQSGMGVVDDAGGFECFGVPGGRSGASWISRYEIGP